MIEGTLQKAKKWLPALVDALFKEHKKDAVAVVAKLVKERDLAGKGVRDAYPTLMRVLDHLDWNPKIKIDPLVPLLEKIVKYRGYDPDGLWQFEAVRMSAFKLLARQKNLVAKVVIDRYLADWPFKVTSEQSSGLAHELCEGAYMLGDKSVAQPLRELLDTLLLEHQASQRNNALGAAYALLDKLGGKRKKKTS